MSYRLGVDVGGTFTDVLLVDEQAGSTWRAKTSSTPQDQSAGVRHGIDLVCAQAGITRGAIAHLRVLAEDAPGEACGDRTPAIHQANLADLQAKYADLATVSEATARLAAG